MPDSAVNHDLVDCLDPDNLPRILYRADPHKFP